eukprot:TRINITY_DN2827_c0_g1_i1.p1 TRINITY_DN2827_c0_g1~~TRINITY_DN2827_c0_g1_i1.p1  ORF type:complete len:627 (-),score=50.63 TRINITY_DN2827_c0_g1_i1:57-1937(-)
MHMNWADEIDAEDGTDMFAKPATASDNEEVNAQHEPQVIDFADIYRLAVEGNCVKDYLSPAAECRNCGRQYCEECLTGDYDCECGASGPMQAMHPEEETDDSEEFRLGQPWTWWYERDMRKGLDVYGYEDAIGCLGTVTTVPQFWRYWTSLGVDQMLVSKERANLSLFRKGKAPTWEHNDGSRLLIPTSRETALQSWRAVVGALIGEDIDTQNVIGATLRIRKHVAIHLWTHRELCAADMEHLKSLFSDDKRATDLEWRYTTHEDALRSNDQHRQVNNRRQATEERQRQRGEAAQPPPRRISASAKGLLMRLQEAAKRNAPPRPEVEEPTEKAPSTSPDRRGNMDWGAFRRTGTPPPDSATTPTVAPPPRAETPPPPAPETRSTGPSVDKERQDRMFQQLMAPPERPQGFVPFLRKNCRPSSELDFGVLRRGVSVQEKPVVQEPPPRQQPQPTAPTRVTPSAPAPQRQYPRQNHIDIPPNRHLQPQPQPQSHQAKIEDEAKQQRPQRARPQPAPEPAQPPAAPVSPPPAEGSPSAAGLNAKARPFTPQWLTQPAPPHLQPQAAPQRAAPIIPAATASGTKGKQRCPKCAKPYCTRGAECTTKLPSHVQQHCHTDDHLLHPCKPIHL